jgi:hypothetical protein
MISHTTLGRRAGSAGYSIILATLLALMPRATSAGTWTPVTATPPGPCGEMLVLSDGSIFFNDPGNGSCFKLVPDIHGSYINGTWQQLATMNNARLYFSQQLLTNGNVYVAGGEYGEGWSHGEVLDTLRDTWTKIPDMFGPPVNAFSDAIADMLPNGDVLQSDSQGEYYFYSPISNTYTYGGEDGDMNEVCWVKMANGCIYAANGYGTGVEHYVPSRAEWVIDSTSPPAGFSGGDDTAFLLPNGNVWDIGQRAPTGIYTPGPTVTSPGTCVNGPNLPMKGTNQCVGGEAPGNVLTTGNILIAICPDTTYSPSYWYEYNYLNNTYTPEGSWGGAVYTITTLDLPDGTVLASDSGGSLTVYTPTGTPLAQGKPYIKTITENADGSYTLTGTNLNGISEGAMNGDDEQQSSNYPLVRMTNGATGNVYYARTFNWNNTGVQTGSTTITTEFTLPQNLPSGSYSLVAVANGNPSAPVTFSYSPPSIPAPTVTSASNGFVNLQWNASSGATAYNVKRSSTVTGYYATLATVTGQSFTDPGLTNGLTYYYKVAAVGSGGPSSDSAVALATPAGPSFIPDATQVNLSAYYNRAGLISDGQTFGGGFDDNGHAFSATLLGSSLWWNNMVFALGPSNAEDVVSCAGQVISLPAGSFNTLQILAAGDNGSQYGQTFTVTYTDNSTATFTQSFSDWTEPQLYPGEFTVLMMPYLDTSDGENQVFSSFVSVDAYEFVLDQTKTVQSITLPNDGNVLIMAMNLANDSAPVSLSAYYNRGGIFWDGTVFTNWVGQLGEGLDGNDDLGDGGAYAYLANQTGNSLIWGNSLFAFGLIDGTNAISCAGQTVTLPPSKCTRLQMLATGVNGGQPSQSFTVNYSDNSTSLFTQSLSDWAGAAYYPGESNVLHMNMLNFNNGNHQLGVYYLYGYTFNLSSNKTVKSILLPSNTNVVVLAISLDPVGLPLTSKLGAAPPIRPQISEEGGNVTLSWSGGIPPYEVQMTTDLSNPNWQVVGTVNDTNLLVTPSNSAAFYRIVGQ